MASSTRSISSRSPKSPVVIDLGSDFIRCGFAGDARPIHVIPSIIGDITDSRSGNPAGARTREEWVEALSPVFYRLFTDSLQCHPRERKIIVCESMVSPRPLREAVAHVLFRFLQVIGECVNKQITLLSTQIRSLHMCAGPAPALFCTGQDTGIVLDVGSREAHVLAVYRGVMLTSSYVGVPLGCRAIHERVGELIAEAEEAPGGEQESGSRRPLTFRELEEVTVRACLAPVGGVPSADEVSPMEFVFSGSRRVTVSGVVRATAIAEAFFEGDEEGRTLATLFLDCLRRCPQDCRRALVQNVIVAGGGAMLPGLCARLGEEIRALARGTRHGVASGVGREQAEGYAWARAVVSGEGGDGASAEGSSGGGSGNGRTGWRGLCVVKVPVRRDHLLWAGASIMSCLNGIEERSITSEEYLERDGGRLPDWMSLSSADWVFEATQTVPAV